MFKKIADIILAIVVCILIIICLFSYIPKCFATEIPFSDVYTSAWYYNDVKTAYQTELIDGMTAYTFEPESYLTYAQAVKLATCMHQRYTNGFVTLTNGTGNWWDNYVYYAKAFNIISKDYCWDNYATRAECAEIFVKALPDEALNIKNNIEDNQIPDVSMAHPQAIAIYKLYRVGILSGMDDYGNFQPYNNIKRSEISAILTRMMNKNARKSFNLKKEINIPIQNNTTTYIVNFNSTGGSPVTEQKVKENEKAVWPSDPVKEGYRFAGWYIDSHLSQAYNFDNPVNSDITLYTKWIRK